MTAAAQDLRIALIGLPNCGKTALFNRLTGSRQKVANYPGVTVERKEGQFRGASGRQYRVLDLPGTYSLTPTTLDEAITRDVALGRFAQEQRPETIVFVADATHLPLSIRLALEVKRLGLPMIVVLNMSDLARKRGFNVDRDALSRELGVPVVETVAVSRRGADSLIAILESMQITPSPGSPAGEWREPSSEDVAATHLEASRILGIAGYHEPLRSATVERIDGVLLHPVYGMLALGVLLFFVFQAVFSWAAWPMDLIDAGVATLAEFVNGAMADGPLRSLLADGIISGVGSVVIFLPQIIILFAFILALEDSGYLPRAAYLLDRVMSSAGLSGRAFIPLLSSFACAIPGIMATRTIPNLRDRLATIMVAPLMTCSARLPVYALLIAAFIPDRDIGWFNLQGIVLFALYFSGVVGALLVAWVFKRLRRSHEAHQLMLELPDYQWPNLQNLALGLWERIRLFLARAGGIILALMVLLWFLSTYPAPPAGATGAPIEYSFAGQLGYALAWVLAPIGFNWQLAWYVFAPQCLATIAVVKRETNGWRYPLIMTGYLFALAYLAAFVTYRLALALGGG
jgi:ferrous iron transport protein B